MLRAFWLHSWKESRMLLLSQVAFSARQGHELYGKGSGGGGRRKDMSSQFLLEETCLHFCHRFSLALGFSLYKLNSNTCLAFIFIRTDRN